MKIFYKLLGTALLSGFAMLVNAQITQPQAASPAASVTQKIGISNVTVNYSRPSVKGRDIWGALVPYGWNKQGFGLGNSAPWRAGANENTTITFDNDAKIQGKEIAAGTYGLFFVMNEDNSGQVILSKDTQAWGSFFYEEANNVLVADITIRDNSMVETLQYDFINMTKTSGELVLNWEKKQFPVKLEFDVDQIVMNKAKSDLKGRTGFGWRGYSSAANYALRNDVELEQGLLWADQAIARNKSFTTLKIKADLLTKKDQKDEAKKLMDEAFTMATEAEINNYGYQLIGQKKMDEAVKIFKMNTEKYPESANAWDSLGEGYVNQGKDKKAIESLKKSLSLNPTAGVKANSEKLLKQLGAM